MNLNLATLPLPSMTRAQADQPRRRHSIGALELKNGALQQFQDIAAAVSTSPAPDLDGIASAARSLIARFSGARHAPCIRQRQRCLAALQAMAAEAAWTLDEVTRQRIKSIARYAANQEQLIPDTLPVVGGLDQAVLVDLLWPSVQAELADYLDFRRLRAEEAALQGMRPHAMTYDRRQWQLSQAAEAAWIAHMRSTGQSSYVGVQAPALFRIH